MPRLAFLLRLAACAAAGAEPDQRKEVPPISDYEILFIVDPMLSDDDIEGVQERLREVAAGHGAEVKQLRVWERRRLAYPIKGRRDGVYVLAQLRMESTAAKELDQHLSLAENVLRHLIVRLDEKEVAASEAAAEEAQPEAASAEEEPTAEEAEPAGSEAGP